MIDSSPGEGYGRLPHHVRRLTLLGAIVGGLIFVGLLIVFLSPVGQQALFLDDPWPEHRRVAPALAVWAMFFSVPPSTLLLFYCLRARTTFRRMVPRYVRGVRVPPAAPADRGVRAVRDPYTFLKSDLNKIRWAAVPLLCVLLLAFGGSADLHDPLACLMLTVGLGAGCLGCCAQLIEVRRALWEVARIEGATFAASGVRGFAVLPTAVAPTAVPVAALPAGPVPAGPVPADPMPAVPLASLAGRVEREQAEAFTDWEKLLHGMAAFGLGIYALTVPGLVDVLANVADSLASAGSGSLARRIATTHSKIRRASGDSMPVSAIFFCNST
jgi:hypothetical protein